MIDYDKYRENYSEELLDKFEHTPEEMTREEMRTMLYGYTSTQAFAEGVIDKRLSIEYWMRLGWSKDRDKLHLFHYYEDEVRVCDQLCGEKRDLPVEKYHCVTVHAKMLILTIWGSGLGDSEENARHVLDSKQELDYLRWYPPYPNMCIKEKWLGENYDCLVYGGNSDFYEDVSLVKDQKVYFYKPTMKGSATKRIFVRDNWCGLGVVEPDSNVNHQSNGDIDYEKYHNSYSDELLNMFESTPEVMTLEDMRTMLYGYTSTRDFAEGVIDRRLSMDYWKDRYLTDFLSLKHTDVRRVIKQLCVHKIPGVMTMDDYYGGYVSPEVREIPKRCNDIYVLQEIMLMLTIETSGDGRSIETAKQVIGVDQEYEYLRRMNLYTPKAAQIKEKWLLDGHVDHLVFRKGEDIHEIFFSKPVMNKHC